MGGILITIVFLYLLGGLLILAITFWPITLVLLGAGSAIWFGWPRILLATDIAVMRLHGWRAKRKLRGLTRMAITRTRSTDPVDAAYDRALRARRLKQLDKWGYRFMIFLIACAIFGGGMLTALVLLADRIDHAPAGTPVPQGPCSTYYFATNASHR